MAAALVAMLLVMVGMPVLPANAVTNATQVPKLTAVKLMSGFSLTPGQAARVQFTLSQPAQQLEFHYLDGSHSETRILTWTGNPGAGSFTAEASAVIGGGDYFDGLQRLSHVLVTYRVQGKDTPEVVELRRNSSYDTLNTDGAGDPLLQSLDFTVKNPGHALRTPQNTVAPKFEPRLDLDWTSMVQGTISKGSWTAGVNQVRVQWVVGEKVEDYQYRAGVEPNVGWLIAQYYGNQVKLRVTTVTPGFTSVSAESESRLFVGGRPVAMTGKPYIGSTLNTDFDPTYIKGLPVGATPKMEVMWRSKSTSYADRPAAPGAGYLVKEADGGGTVSAVAVISVDGKVVGRFATDWTDYVTNPAPSRNYVSREVSDFVMTRTTDGRLWMWGRYFGAFPKEVGSGWNAFDKIFSPGDFDEDGHADVLARKPSGELWLYPADGQYWWKPASKVGVGWQGMTELFAPGDFDEDGHDDVLARDRDGRLLLYPGNGRGGWLAPRQVGAGWNMFNRVFSPGDFDGDSHADILATNASGQLFLYSSNGKGGWLGAKVIGSGWQSFKNIFSAGDRSGDGWVDIYGVDGAGYMYLYPFKSGSWKPRALVGADWDVFTVLF